MKRPQLCTWAATGRPSARRKKAQVEHTAEDRPDEPSLSLGGAILDDEALDALLQRVVQLARRTVAGAHAVSITVVDNGGYRTSNSVGTDALAVDEAQYALNDGPCLAGIRTGEQRQFTIDEVGERWSTVAERAEELGVAGVLSTPLVVDGPRSIGALNVYATEENRFGDEERGTALLLSEHAAILLGNALALTGANRLNEQLRHAVASREIIGEAKGILMERESCTRDEAFDILRRASQRENRKLRDLAEEIVLRVEARKRHRPPQ